MNELPKIQVVVLVRIITKIKLINSYKGKSVLQKYEKLNRNQSEFFALTKKDSYRSGFLEVFYKEYSESAC